MKEKLLKTNGLALNSIAFIVHRSSFRFAFLLLAFVLAAQGTLAVGAWTKQQSGTLTWLHAVYFLDQNRGWVAGGSGVFLATTDGGETWQATRRPTEDTIRDIHFFDERNGWIVCERSIFLLKSKDEQRSYLMRTTDGGATWRRINLNGDPDARLLRVLLTGDGHGWVFGEGGMIFATQDGGSTWLKKRAPTRHVLFGGAFLDQAQLWLVGSGATVIQTRDGGETWRMGNVLGITRAVRFTATSFVDKARGWAVGNEGSVFMTVDGGRTWSAQTSNVQEDLADVKFLDATEGWAVGAAGTLIHTTDGGFHWTVEDARTTHPLERIFFINRERGWAVGFGGTILSYTRNATNKAPALKQPPVLKRAGL